MAGIARVRYRPPAALLLPIVLGTRSAVASASLTRGARARHGAKSART
jgi:hypothetical protein